MDFIKKTICIEDARSRTRGLLPYYGVGKIYEQHAAFDSAGTPICYGMDELGLETASGNNGNWGGIVANPCFLAEKNKTYKTAIDYYYYLLNSVRNGIKLRKVKTKEGEIIFVEDVGAFEINGECFSGGTEPETLYVYAAYDEGLFYSSTIDSIREETKVIYRTDTEVEDDFSFVVLIRDYNKFSLVAKYLDDVTLPTSVTQQTIGDNEHTKWADYCKVMDDFIGKIEIPEQIYNKHIKAPKTIPCADIDDTVDWLENYQSLSADCCNMRLWDDMGGEDLLKYLKDHQGECQDKLSAINALPYAVPYLEIPLLLVHNFTDVGVLTNVGGVEYDDTLDETGRPFGPAHYQNKRGVCALTIDQIVMGSKRMTYPTTEEFEKNPEAYTDENGFIRRPIEVESLLKTLRTRKKYTDDKDNVLPGMFQLYTNPAGQMYACVRHSDEKFYQLTKESYVIIENGQNKTYWRVIYTEATMTRDDIYGMNNFMDDMPANPFAEHLTEEEANSILEEQSAHYTDVEKDAETNPYVYKICVSDSDWEIFPYALGQTPEKCINADGLSSQDVVSGGTRYPDSDDFRTAAGKLYRTITTPSAGIRIAQTEEEETGIPAPKDYHYFFMVKYNNSSGSPMTIPYKEGNTANVYLVESGATGRYLYRGDFIQSITAGSGFFEVKYVIGGYFYGDENGKFTSYAGSGDVYYEKRIFDPAHVDYVALDGVDRVPVWSEYVDFNADAKELYSPRFNLYRTGNTANIIEMTTGEIWNKEYAYDAYLTKEEYLTNFSSPPKVDVDITVDRGGTSVFEKHYRLSECNTLEDLINIGNNIFDL